DANRRVSRTLPLGAGPLGAGPALLVQGAAWLRHSAGDAWLRAGGSRRLREGGGRVARSCRARAVEFLAAPHSSPCDGNDRTPGRRARLDGGARSPVVGPWPYERGPYLVAQGAVSSRARAI